MYVGFDEITLEDLTFLKNAVIDGDNRIVIIGGE